MSSRSKSPEVPTHSSTVAPTTSDKPGDRVEAVSRGLRLLSLFDERRPAWRVAELAGVSNLPISTVYRDVQTLAAEGYLDRLPAGYYRPGIRALALGTAALRSLDVVAVATPRLQGLRDRTGEAVSFGTLVGDRVLFLVRLGNSDLVSANLQVGSTLPGVTTAIGKVLLAELPQEDWRLCGTHAWFTAHHGPDVDMSPENLRRQFEQIRGQGWAMQDADPTLGFRSVAAPVRGKNGEFIGGVNLAVRAHDWGNQRIARELRPALLYTCADISTLLTVEPH